MTNSRGHQDSTGRRHGSSRRTNLIDAKRLRVVDDEEISEMEK